MYDIDSTNHPCLLLYRRLMYSCCTFFSLSVWNGDKEKNRDRHKLELDTTTKSLGKCGSVSRSVWGVWLHVPRGAVSHTRTFSASVEMRVVFPIILALWKKKNSAFSDARENPKTGTLL